MDGSDAGEQEADGNDDERGQIAGQWAIDSDIHERQAIGDAAANLNDCAGGAAECGRGQDPGES